ncbi:type VII secretion integral membrane protein EccD [Actinomadura bangladeshensis]|uniref:Type VII secretion integral membrane protein EccD n=1 Tax=Actinomadura bangladeshensis TaxID=453573 RepID=A0A4V6P9T2_9ACTN|nr:type VII secretion integral membrane protein EccD [Actinomadura bangladeshensis]TDC05206.1 type VII secretion integral membrane protein EccD [Actinomadura bangladeshensis]
MASVTGAELCRVTVVAPKRRIDISLPAHVPFAQFFPAILHYSGAQMADAGLAHGGWVLQRLDEAPFDGGMTPSQAGLRDGEVLYLRPGMSQLPELAFDDVADVVATAINDRRDRWRPEWTRQFSLSVGGGASVVAAIVVLLAGPSWIVPAAAAGVICLLYLAAAVSVSRAAGDERAGTVLGFAALPHAFLAGLLGPARDTAFSGLDALNALAGFGTLVLAAVIAVVGVTGGASVFWGMVVGGLLGAIGSAVALAFGDLSAGGIAAVTVVVAMMLTPLTPTLAFRFSKVTLPPVPQSAEDLRRDTIMVDGQQVLTRTGRANRFITGFTAGLGVIAFIGLVPSAFDDGWLGPTTASVISVLVLLRSRLFRSRAQRLNLLVPGVLGIAAVVVGQAWDASAAGLVAGAILPLVLVAGTFTGVGLWLPGHRPSPFWSRAGDILEMFLLIALIPLALGECGLFAYMRGLAG